MTRFAQQVALVTGGGTGIGEAVSLLLAEEGAAVAVNYSRSQAEAEAVVAKIEKTGGRAMAVQADVSRDDQVCAMVDNVVETLGRLDILVNNAGTTERVPYTDLDGMTDLAWDRIMAVNAKGTFLCSRAAIKAMKIQGSGQIINTTSISAYTGQGSCIAYSASKAAIINITRALAVSQAPEIRVNAVAPGVVETRWIEGMEEFTDPHREATPMGRLATPEDVALAVFGLAINEFITGKTLVVDGGRSLVC
jgi:3-oxoacyl-[acyl-carrier protein] reductase